MVALILNIKDATDFYYPVVSLSASTMREARELMNDHWSHLYKYPHYFRWMWEDEIKDYFEEDKVMEEYPSYPEKEN